MVACYRRERDVVIQWLPVMGRAGCCDTVVACYRGEQDVVIQWLPVIGESRML